jgi:predicted enzyme related to lactoylglutathione lyase
MATCRFGRYELLTTDVPRARGFYEAVFGAEFWGPDITLGALPERALALGVALPIAQAPDGAQVAACDDAQGTAFGLYQPALRASPSS